MKHKWPVTLLLLSMFLLTQVIGIYVVGSYTGQDLPYGLETPEDEPTTNFISIIIAFAIAFGIIFVLMKYNLRVIIRVWFFFVVALALALAINSVLKNYYVSASLVSFFFGLIFSYVKIFRPNVFMHNATELLIYPGIAVVFVPLLSPISVLVLLIAISLYDMWAVWKSDFMVSMAKYQMEEVKVFGGFLLPSVSDKDRTRIQKLRKKYKGKKVPQSVAKKKFKVNLAILGGGDVVFPIITSGVFLVAFGLIPAFFIMGGAFAGLLWLFLFSEKDRAYPAMPYITLGIFVALALWAGLFL